MADSDGIVQNIVLAGDREVIDGFNRIGEAGSRAFENLSLAIEHGVNSLGGIALLASGLVAAFAGLSVGAFKFVEAMAETAEKTNDLSSATGVSIENITGMQAAFAAGGVSASELGQSFRRLSIVIQQSWSEIKKSASEAGDNAKRNVLNIEGAQASLAASQRELTRIETDQNNQRIASSSTLVNAELKLREVRSQQAAARGIDTSGEDLSIRRARDRLALEEAEQAVVEAGLRKEREAADQAAALEAAKRKEKTDTLSLRQLERKAIEDDKNDITKIVKAVQDLASGDKDALKGINASAENLAKGIIGAAGASEHALDGLKGDITDIASDAPGVQATFLKIGEALGNIADPALRAATAARLLNRAVSQQELKVLADPKKIEEYTDRIKQFSIDLSEHEVHNLDKFREALLTLQFDIGKVSEKIGATLAPAFTETLQIVNNALLNNKDKLIDFAQTISGSVLGAVQSLVRVLAGNPLPGDEWVANVISALKSLGSFIGTVAGLVVAGVKIISTAFAGVAKDINDAFGTNLTGTELFVGAWVASIAASIIGGLFPLVALTAGIARNIALGIGAALTAGTPAIVAAVAAVIGALGPLAVVLTGLVATVKLIEATKDLLGDKDKGDAIKEGFAKRIEALGDMVKATNFDELTAAFDKFNKATADQVAKEAAIDQDRLQNKKTFSRDLQEIEKAQEKREDRRFEADDRAQSEVDAPRGGSQSNARRALASDAAEFNRANQDAIEESKNKAAARDAQTTDKVAPVTVQAAQETSASAHTLEAAGSSHKDAAKDHKEAAKVLKEAGAVLIAANKDKLKQDLTESETQDRVIKKDNFERQIGDSGLPPGTVRIFKGDGAKNPTIVPPREQDTTPSPTTGLPPGAVSKTSDGDFKMKDGSTLDPRTGVRTFRGEPSGGVAPSVATAIAEAAAKALNVKPEDVDFGGFRTGRGAAVQGSESKLIRVPEDVERVRQRDLAEELQRERLKGNFPQQEPVPLPQQRPADLQAPLPLDINKIIDQFLKTQPQGAPQLKPQDAPQQPIQGDQVPELNNTIGQLNESMKTLAESFQQKGGEGDGSGDASTALDKLASSAEQLGSSMADASSQIVQAAAAIASAAQASAASSSSGTVSAAGGGHIQGPGGTTGDKIPAMVSHDEFIHRAAATNFWGVDLMYAINNLDVGGVMGRIGRGFRDGGLVSFSPQMPRHFRDGDLASAAGSERSIPLLGMLDLRTDHGPARITVAGDSIDSLKRLAENKRRSSGTKRTPGFVS